MNELCEPVTVEIPPNLSKRQRKKFIKKVLWETKWKPLKRYIPPIFDWNIYIILYEFVFRLFITRKSYMKVCIVFYKIKVVIQFEDSMVTVLFCIF